MVLQCWAQGHWQLVALGGARCLNYTLRCTPHSFLKVLDIQDEFGRCFHSLGVFLCILLHRKKYNLEAVKDNFVCVELIKLL